MLKLSMLLVFGVLLDWHTLGAVRLLRRNPREVAMKYSLHRAAGHFRRNYLVVFLGIVAYGLIAPLGHTWFTLVLPMALYLYAANRSAFLLVLRVAGPKAKRVLQPKRSRHPVTPAAPRVWLNGSQYVVDPSRLGKLLHQFGFSLTDCTTCWIHTQDAIAENRDALALSLANGQVRGPKTAAVLAGEQTLAEAESLWEVRTKEGDDVFFVTSHPFSVL